MVTETIHVYVEHGGSDHSLDLSQATKAAQSGEHHFLNLSQAAWTKEQDRFETFSLSDHGD